MMNFNLNKLLSNLLEKAGHFWSCRQLSLFRQQAIRIVLILSMLLTAIGPETARAYSSQSAPFAGEQQSGQSRLNQLALVTEEVSDPPDGAPDYYYATGVAEAGYIPPIGNENDIAWSFQTNALGPQDGLDAKVINKTNSTHACLVVTFADQPYIERGEIMAYVHQPQPGTKDMGMQLSVSDGIPSCDATQDWIVVFPYRAKNDEVGGPNSGGPGWYGVSATSAFTGTLQAVRIEIWSGGGNILGESREFYIDSVRIKSSIPDESALSENEPKNGAGDERECAIATCAGSQASGGDPVNTRTGNFDYSLVDLTVQTPAGPLTFQRSYASQAASLYPTTSVSGAGWTNNHDIRLISGAGFMRFKAHTANQYKFFDRGSNAYSSAPGVTASLVYSATLQAYVITASDRSTYTFQDSDNGKVTRWRNRRGFGFDYTYDPATGALTQVTEPVSGRFLRFTYDNPAAPVHIIRVESNLGQVSYGYTNGELTSFTDVMGHTWQYFYDTGSKHRLIQITAPDGQVVLKVNYDSSGRVTKQWNGLPANQSTLIVELTYGANRTTTIKDALGRATIHKYNTQGALVSETDPAGYITTYAYDVNLRPIAITDQDGRQTVLKWSRNGARLVYVQDAATYTTTLSYDPLGNLTQINAPLERQTSFTYNGVLLTSSTLHTSLGDVTTVYSYTTGSGVPAGLLETITDPLLRQTHFSYDAQGQLIAVRDAADNVTTLAYDVGGRVTDITRGADPVTQTIHIDYNAANQVIRVKLNPDQSKPQNAESQYNLLTEYAYDVRGRLTQVTNTMGDKIVNVYDNADRLTQVSNTNSLGTKTISTSYGYNDAGQLTLVTDPLSHSWTLEYDDYPTTVDGNPKSGRLIKVSDPLSHAFSLAYNPDSTILSVTDPLSYTVTYQYDPLKRVSLVQDTANHWASYTYDAYGNVLTATDAKGRVTKYEYDERNALTAVTQNYLNQSGSGSDWNVRTTYEYNLAGSLTRITDANLHATRFEYDALNRLQRKIDPLLHETTFGYDAFGNLGSVHYPNNYTTTYQYDRVNRLRSIDYPTGTADVTLAYDPLGRLIGMDDGLGHTALNWDYLGRLTSLTDPFNKTVGYGYDDAGNRTQLAYPGGPTLTYAYDQADRLTEVREGAALLAQYGYDNANRLTSVSLANGVVSGYIYDRSGQLTALSHQTASGKLSSYLYEYDTVGNRIRAIENPFQIHLSLLMAKPAASQSQPGAPAGQADGAVSFWQGAVDFVGRLLAWDATAAAQGSDAETSQSSSLPVTSISYTYDGLDRLTQAAYATGETYTYAYDKAGNRTSQTNPGGTINYTYDSANRLTSVNGTAYTWDDNGNLLGDGSSTYTYDHANRLTGVAGPGNTYSFAYNGLGDRYQQTANGSPVNYTLDLSGALSQVLSDGQNTYLYGLGRIAQETLAGKEYFLPDGLGSVRQLANGSGSVTLSRSFDPFGSLRSQSGASASSYGFAGEWTDATGLQYLRARYYSPQQGRFLTSDPFPGFMGMPQTQNPYIYALNNPTLLTDPSGELAFIPVMAAAMLGGAIGGIAYYGIRTALSDDPCAAWDWMQAALWGGAGAVFGAALGMAIYGGWWVGAQLGWWGTVLSADGDPTNEIITGTNTVYRLVENGVTRYVGITNDFARRSAEHLRQSGWTIRPIPGLEYLSRGDARAVEQVLIQFYGLENLYNRINSIAVTNIIYPQAIQRGMDILRMIGFFSQ